MSRKMIEYEVADGKITSIDGYKVGGAKYEIKTFNKNIYMGVPAGTYTIGQRLNTNNAIYQSPTVVFGSVRYPSKSSATIGTATFVANTIISQMEGGNIGVFLTLTCIQPGTVEKATGFQTDVIVGYLNEQAS